MPKQPWPASRSLPSVDGNTHVLEQPFIVIATQNPVEQFGTFSLPEAQVTGKIAIGSEDLIEGMLANRLLARWGYYSDESGQGGSYSKEIASKMLVCKSADEMVSSLKKDKAQLAFGVQSMLWGDFAGIEQVYQPAYGIMVYAGATLPNVDCAGVARDFMEFITRCV